MASPEQAVLAPAEFIGDERGHEIDGDHLLRLGLSQARLQDGRYARQSQLPEGAIEFVLECQTRSRTALRQ